MGKRSDFKREARDLYPTPAYPVNVLSPYLFDVRGFVEPTVGNCDLARHLEALGHRCTHASDIEPSDDAVYTYGAETLDLLDLDEARCVGASHIITNTPWPHPSANGKPTVAMVEHLASLRPSWLLLSADFKHNRYASHLMDFCKVVVSVGRVKWIPDSQHQAVDNAAWYLFDRNNPGDTIFKARHAIPRTYAHGIEDLL